MLEGKPHGIAPIPQVILDHQAKKKSQTVAERKKIEFGDHQK